MQREELKAHTIQRVAFMRQVVGSTMQRCQNEAVAPHQEEREWTGVR